MLARKFVVACDFKELRSDAFCGIANMRFEDCTRGLFKFERDSMALRGELTEQQPLHMYTSKWVVIYCVGNVLCAVRLDRSET